MKRRLLILPVLAGFVLSGCSIQDLMFWKKKDSEQTEKESKDEQDQGQSWSVTSVTVSASKTKLAPGGTLQLTATVVVNNASKAVTWSSSDESIATVSSTGLVTAKSVEGPVTITATSTVDSSKSGSINLTVVDEGFDPAWIDQGFTFSKTFPAGPIATFLNVNESDIPVLEDAGGFYYLQEDATATVPAYIIVVADGTVAEEYQDAMIDKGSEKNYISSQGAYEAVSADLKFTISAYEETDDEYEPCAPTFIEFYRSEDVWEDDTSSTDTEWDFDKFDEDTADYYSDEAKAILANIPFLPIGKNYEISYVDNSLYRWYGYDLPDYVTIGDYSLADSLVEGYGAVLTKAGNDFEYITESDVYYKAVGYDAYVVYEDFSETGNTYYIMNQLAELDAFPSEGVKDFAEKTLKSVYTLPEYTQTANAIFTFESGLDENDEPYAEVMAYEVKFTEAQAYVEVCKTDGFSSTFHEETDEDYPYWELQKGRICVELIFVQAYDETTEEYSQTDGDLKFEITGDLNVFEVPGLYLAKDSGKVCVGKTLELDVMAYQLGENPTISYVSADPSIATVSTDGVISGVAVGQTTITASTTYNAEDYSVEFTINVVNEVTDVITLDKLGLSDVGTTYTNFSGKKDESDAVYAGQCAGDKGTIQIRSKNSNSGIYSSTSGGKIKSVTLYFGDNDTSTKGVKIVASHTAFESTSDLFGNSATIVATLTQDEYGMASYTFTENYEYVGVISADGAHYFDSIEFVWAA